MNAAELKKHVNHINNEDDIDVLYVNAPMERGVFNQIVVEVSQRKLRNTVCLILVTSGGDPDAAFRISRLLQSKYKNFEVLIPGWCKSAGTLLSIGAQHLIFGQMGELGPLDVQMGKKDELYGYTSGLDVQYGINHIQNTGFHFFETCMLRTMKRSRFQVTLKTAAEIATGLAQAYISKMSEQISPMAVGETVRVMGLADAYGSRLNEKFKNLIDQDCLDRLVSGYQSHGFVIDYEEAKTLFKSVVEARDAYLGIVEALGPEGCFPMADDTSATIAFLNPERQNDDEKTDKAQCKSNEDTEFVDESKIEGNNSVGSDEKPSAEANQYGPDEGNQSDDKRVSELSPA